MTAPPSAEEVAEAIRNLTRTQRQAIVGGSWNVHPITHSLRECGIVVRTQGYHVELTALGLAVRNHLIGETR